MSDSSFPAPRVPALQFLRSSPTTVPPTGSSLSAMMIAPASDTSFLFFLCKTFLPSFLMMPSSRNQPPQPPALTASERLLTQPVSTTSTRNFVPPSSSKGPTRQRRSSSLSSQALVMTSLLWSLSVLCVAEAQTCTKTHPFVGFRGTFTPNLGTIQVLDDCSFSYGTFAGFNNATLRGFRWGGIIVNGNGELQRVGVISSAVVPGSDFVQAFPLSPGVTWNSMHILTIQSTAGEIIAQVPLGRPSATPTTTRTTTTTTTTTTTSIIATTTSSPSPITIVISPPGTFSATPNATAAPLKSPVPTIIDPASPIIVRTGPNPNYPGLTPTVLNISLWINDTESPVLLMKRGKRYTFSIQSGAAHPVYITTSREGGKKNVANSTEIVLAGNITTFGNISAPFLLDFVAPLKGEIAGLNDTTALFYQCYIHRRMGWKIIFDDEPNSTNDAGTSGANVATRGAGGVALVVLLIATVTLML